MTEVYFIECAGRIKVGYSANAQTRIKELSTAAPTRPIMLGFVTGGRSLEKAIHRKLKPFNDHREWFTDCQPVRGLIEDVLVRGAAALGIPEEPKTARVPKEKSQFSATKPVVLEWWQVATKGLTAIFNRYEYTIINHPVRAAQRAAFSILNKAQGQLERMLDGAVSDNSIASETMAKVQQWLAAVESQMSMAVALASPAKSTRR